MKDDHTAHLFTGWFVTIPLLFTLMLILMYDFSPIRDHEADKSVVGAVDRASCRVVTVSSLLFIAFVLLAFLLWLRLWHIPKYELRDSSSHHTDNNIPSASYAPVSPIGGWLPSAKPTHAPTVSVSPAPITVHHATSMRLSPTLLYVSSAVVHALSVLTNFAWRFERDNYFIDIEFAVSASD
jgi:hypothetical protein